ncbi:MAG: phosphoribosylformylglycinamidine cyclo-ligase [Gemmatimonadota bacterium]
MADPARKDGAMDYRSTGVDLDSAERTKDALKALVDSTRDAHTLSHMGLFGGLYQVPADLREPVLVSSADGVGTKLKVAFMTGRHGTVGQDLVNHCVNDILVQGARPIFFLDYLATGKLDEDVVPRVVEGMALACKANGCALLGGETAQMPDFYQAGEYDLAGFIVGVVEKAALLDGTRIEAGDRLIALPSSGLHTNGYTLARAILFERLGLGVDDALPWDPGTTVADALLAVHRSYLQPLAPLLDDGHIRGLAHITGGGIPGNLPRILPQGLGAAVDRSSWTVPALFQGLQEAGEVHREEMYRVFNMGVGMVVAVAASEAERVLALLEEAGETPWMLGQVTSGSGVVFQG